MSIIYGTKLGLFFVFQQKFLEMLTKPTDKQELKGSLEGILKAPNSFCKTFHSSKT